MSLPWYSRQSKSIIFEVKHSQFEECVMPEERVAKSRSHCKAVFGGRGKSEESETRRDKRESAGDV